MMFIVYLLSELILIVNAGFSLSTHYAVAFYSNDFVERNIIGVFSSPFIGDQTLVNLNHLSHHAIHGSPSGNIMSKSRLSVDV